MKKNVAIIFGGKSTEHDISILTACQVMNALNKNKYNLFPVYISQNGKWLFGKKLFDVEFYSKFNEKLLKEVSILPQDNYLYKKIFSVYKKIVKLDCAIICCHGKNGEDGTLQGLLELSGIPYTSSGVLGSSVGLDKQAMKQMFVANKIPVCPFACLSKKEYEEGGLDYLLQQIELPVVVKPSNLGSSIGISVAKTLEELDDALNLAFTFDDNIVVEKLIEDMREINISVLGDCDDCMCSVTEEPKKMKEILTFDEKYLSGNKIKTDASKLNGMQNLSRIIPAQISTKQQNKICFLAEEVFKKLKCKGVVRIDFIIDNQTKKIYVNEINTIPGSFAFYLWDKKDIKFDKLLDLLIEIAERNRQKEDKLLTTFDTSVLKGKNVVAK